MSEKEIVLALGRDILELKTTTSSLVGFGRDAKARAFETERDPKMMQKTVALSGPQPNTLTQKVSYLTEELYLILAKSLLLWRIWMR